jgi:hypothetical protein
VKSSGFRWAACAVILGAASAAAAQEGPKFELHGFVGGSLYAQDAVFNDFGQKVFFVTKTPNSDRTIFGADVRQTRLNFSVAGPRILHGAIPKAVVEIDWFGPTNLASSTTTNADGTVTVNQTSTADYNLVPRLRLAYAELAWSPVVIRVGQDTVLLAGFFPATVGHIANPFALGAGLLFSREQMVEIFYTARADDTRIELAVQVMKPTSNASKLDVTGQSYAESSGLPGVEGRVRLIVPKLVEAYVAGHWNSIDRNGMGNTVALPAGFTSRQTVAAGNVGAKLTLGPLTVQGQAYVGNNIGYQSNFDSVPGISQGDLHEWGAWGQVGYNITPELSAWAFIGTTHPNYDEAKALRAKLQNTTTHAMLRYQQGGYAIGLEGLHMITHYASNPANSEASKGGVLEGNQLMLSGMYFF